MRERLDPLIEERAPWLFSKHPAAPLLRAVVERGLAYDMTLNVARHVEGLSSQKIMSEMAKRIARLVDATGFHNLPRSGPALIVANHPTGIADGIVLHHVLAQLRPDMFIYANSDILRVLPQMSGLIIPVEWRKEKRTHQKTKLTLELTAQAVKEGRLGVIFPSGRLAKRQGLRLYEREWMPSAVMIARKFDLPIVPVNLQARNSALFYLLDLIHPTLRDITLFHETLNKDRQPYRLRIGPAVTPRELPSQSCAAIEVLRERTLSLAGQDGPAVSMVRSTPLLKRLRLV